MSRSRPTLSVLVASSGRSSLSTALESVVSQLLPGDELLLDVNEDRDWGHAAMNRKISQARGDFLLFLDDDNIFLPGTLDVVRRAVAEVRRPVHIFRMRYRENGFVLWEDPELREGNVAGQMVAVARSPALGEWSPRYEGDFDFLRDTVDRLGEPVWHEDVIAEIHHPELAAKIGVVTTACAGHEGNLRRMLASLRRLHPEPNAVVVVLDGVAPALDRTDDLRHELDAVTAVVPIAKHQAGAVQPRNVGFGMLRQLVSDIEYVWFLDADLLVASDALRAHADAVRSDRVLVGPYDWLAPGVVEPDPALRNDIRWSAFARYDSRDARFDTAGWLACLGGNIVFPVDVFGQLGGFHPDLPGRCEDGELALRIREAKVPVAFVRNARAWHLWHPVDLEDVYAKNRANNPKLLEWHPWLADEGFVLVDEDGRRFDYVCPDCGEQMNCHSFWSHRERHEDGAFEPPVLIGWPK